MKAASINREIALLERMFTKTVEWGKLNDSPAKKLRLLKGEVRRVGFLTVDEIQRLISNCCEHLKPIAMSVGRSHGYEEKRGGESEMGSGEFRRGFIVLTDTKNREVRNIALDETAKAVLNGIENAHVAQW